MFNSQVSTQAAKAVHILHRSQHILLIVITRNAKQFAPIWCIWTQFNENFYKIMPVLHLTIFISIILAVIFIVCFVMEAWRNKNQGVEQTSLLPLQDDSNEPKPKQTEETNSSKK